MSGALVRVGVGTRFVYDGELVEIVEFAASAAGSGAVVRDGRGRVARVAVRELLAGERARIVADDEGPGAADTGELAAVVLDQLSDVELQVLRERAAHVREVLTGYRSGSAELAGAGEPRASYAPGVAMGERYRAKAQELGVGYRSVERWAAAFRREGEAGLAPDRPGRRIGAVSARFEAWAGLAREVMGEHVGASKPSRSFVIDQVGARAARLGEPIAIPSRATAFRVLEQLERRTPLFRLSTARSRDVAGRPEGAYGKLRPSRPGEYMLMDTTRLDVFGLDPVTARWVQAELTVAMDWYTRCVTGVRVTPVSTKAVDACATLYQCFRPREAGPGWPAGAVWPEHGVPAQVLVDREAIEGPVKSAAGPAIVPETLVVDHGKIYVGEHLTSVCRRLGISVQPARLRTGRDKGPIERFFRTLREDLLQKLPGYKGPDLASRGASPESEAVLFLPELEAIIREWVACDYHHCRHAGLVDAHVPGLMLSPAQMFEHGMARAGYIQAPRDPDLAFEFLPVRMRTIQHYGVQIGRRRYNGAGLDDYRSTGGPYQGRSWAFHVDPDDVTRIYFRDPRTRVWHALWWEHAAGLEMPLSEEALGFARTLVAARVPQAGDIQAVALLLERWKMPIAATRTERRIALRLAMEHSGLQLPAAEPAPPARYESGDDDGADEFAPDGLDLEEFYARALEDA